jgi:hypothetical protein
MRRIAATPGLIDTSAGAGAVGDMDDVYDGDFDGTDDDAASPPLRLPRLPSDVPRMASERSIS